MMPVRELGRRAYAAGLGLKDNPGTDYGFAWNWRKGWLLARREDRKRRRALRRAGDYAAWPPTRRGKRGARGPEGVSGSAAEEAGSQDLAGAATRRWETPEA